MPCLHPFVYHFACFCTCGDLRPLTLCAQNLKLIIAIQKMICLFFLEISCRKISIWQKNDPGPGRVKVSALSCLLLPILRLFLCLITSRQYRMHQLAQLSSLTKYTLVLVTWPNLSSTWLSQFLKSKTRCWKCVLLMASPMPWNSSGIVEQDSVPSSQQVILMSSYFTFICWHKSVESIAKILSCLSFSTELCNCVRSLFWGGKECAMLNKTKMFLAQ